MSKREREVGREGEREKGKEREDIPASRRILNRFSFYSWCRLETILTVYFLELWQPTSKIQLILSKIRPRIHLLHGMLLDI